MYSTSSERYLEQPQTCELQELHVNTREILGNTSTDWKAMGQSSWNTGDFKKRWWMKQEGMVGYSHWFMAGLQMSWEQIIFFSKQSEVHSWVRNPWTVIDYKDYVLEF